MPCGSPCPAVVHSGSGVAGALDRRLGLVAVALVEAADGLPDALDDGAGVIRHGGHEVGEGLRDLAAQAGAVFPGYVGGSAVFSLSSQSLTSTAM